MRIFQWPYTEWSFLFQNYASMMNVSVYLAYLSKNLDFLFNALFDWPYSVIRVKGTSCALKISPWWINCNSYNRNLLVFCCFFFHFLFPLLSQRKAVFHLRLSNMTNLFTTTTRIVVLISLQNVRRIGSGTLFARQMQIIKQNNVKPLRTPTEYFSWKCLSKICV